MVRYKETNIVKAVLPKLMYTFNSIPHQNFRGFFFPAEIDKQILKFI